MVTKLIRRCAMRTAALAERVWDAAGAVEMWCDERASRKGWVKMCPEDYAIPSPDGYRPVTPRPLVMLDTYEKEQD